MSRPFSEPDVFSAIADPTRRAILTSLLRGEKSVAELARPFDMSLPAVSQHLRVLRSTDLVIERRSGRQLIYRVNAKSLEPVAKWLCQYEKFWKSRLRSLKRHLDEEEI
jgi:DNA-binding transcriptional ArsR family regulator